MDGFIACVRRKVNVWRAFAVEHPWAGICDDEDDDEVGNLRLC